MSTNRLYQIWTKFEQNSKRTLTDVGIDSRGMSQVESEPVAPEEVLPGDFVNPSAAAMTTMRAIGEAARNHSARGKGRSKAARKRQAPERSFGAVEAPRAAAGYTPPLEAPDLDKILSQTDLSTRRSHGEYLEYLTSGRAKRDYEAAEARRRDKKKTERKKFLGIF